MPKHSQGPWRLIKHNGCNLYGGKSPSSDWFIFENALEKDANLIAAAPELLEALQDLVHLHLCEQEGVSSGMPTREQWFDAVDKASKAIKKAEGGTKA